MIAAIAATLLGIWLMAAPAVLGYAGLAADHDRIAGPIAASFAWIAISAVTRPMRRVVLVTGAWIALAPFVLGFEGAARWNGVVTGVLLVALSLVRGQVRDRFGGGWRAAFQRARRPARNQRMP